MSSFKRSDTKIFRSKKLQTPESAYWKKLEVPVLIKEFGPVDYVNFTSTEPYYFAVTSSARVQIYNPFTKQVHKNLNKFKETAYGGSFRSDGQLLCAGSEEPVVRLFDVATRTLLRRFKGHTGAVHRTHFTSDNTHIASFSDDTQVILWDIATEQKITQFKDHIDYIRAGCVSPISPNIIMSGSYDKMVNMYDTRDKSMIFTMDHGAPVECILFSPSGSIFVSAGGKEVRVWDVFTRSLLTKFTQYHKTVTCMCYSSKGKRLLTGSLDKRVKVIDTKTYRVLHTMSYPAPVLSVGVSEDENILVTGMVNSLLSVQKRNVLDLSKQSKKKVPRRYVGDTSSYDATVIDTVVPSSQWQKISTYENALRKFQYSKALDTVMVHRIAFKKPAIVVTLFNELIRRRGLMSAVSGRDSKQLATILRFIIRYLCVDRFTKILIEVSDTIIDAYFDVIETYSMEVKHLFRSLRDTVKQEENITRQLLELQGGLEMLFLSATFNPVA